MVEPKPRRVAIIDYTLGNLFSVLRACEQVDLDGFITSSWKEMNTADAVIMPGVGAYGDAIAALHRLDLYKPIRDYAASGRLLIGICLGMQLLMEESCEFGRHPGLGLIRGDVTLFENPGRQDGTRLKVPQVGWNRIFHPGGLESNPGAVDRWRGTPLAQVKDGEYMYFVHSYYVRTTDPQVNLSCTRYGSIDFCSSLQAGNIYAFQFHPERSARNGLRIYQNLASMIEAQGK